MNKKFISAGIYKVDVERVLSVELQYKADLLNPYQITIGDIDNKTFVLDVFQTHAAAEELFSKIVDAIKERSDKRGIQS